MTNFKVVTNDSQIPPLRYQDQTPLVQGNVQKRLFLELSSPYSETEKLRMNKIEETVQRSFKTMLPGVIETLKKFHSTSYRSGRRSCASHERGCFKRSETGTQVHGRENPLTFNVANRTSRTI